MGITEKDIMLLLQEYAQSEEGKRRIKENGYGDINATVDAATLKSLTAELRNRLNDAFMRNNLEGSPITENINNLKITYRLTGKKGMVFTITFPPLAIGRLSLSSHSSDPDDVSRYTGSKYHRDHAAEFEGLDMRYGVYDIIGLFVSGYTIQSKIVPKGYWYQADMGEFLGEGGGLGRHRNEKIQAKRFRAPNDFVTPVIDKFISDHINQFPDLRVEYPKEWGGTK